MFPQTVISSILCALLVQGGSLQPNLERRQVKIDDFRFQALAAPRVIGQQRKSNWCWAAAIQMVLNYNGIFVSQEQLVQQKFGALVDRSADGYEIMKSLNGWFWSIFSSRTRVSAWVVDMTADTQFLNLLASKKPMIAGLRGSSTEAAGHAYVVTGAEYSMDPSGQGVIVRSVTVRDPWPTNPSEQTMAWEEFRGRFMFAIGISATALL